MVNKAKTLGEIAYNAFIPKLGEYYGIPTREVWGRLPQGERLAWEAAALAVWNAAGLNRAMYEASASQSEAFLATAE